jgi:ubiquinone/menaquinone biosynthesis C-methylase UbiE
MRTSDFNLLDHIIAHWRLTRVKKYIKKKDVVLDFGCGMQSLLLNKIRFIIKKGVGIDSHVENYESETNISYIKHEFVNQLPLESNFFDVITILAVYEHIALNKTGKLLNEFYRVLKPGGIVIMTVPSPISKPILEFLAFNLKVISRIQIEDHKKYYTKNCLFNDLQASKLEVYQHHYFQFGCNNFIIAKKLIT